MSKFKVGDIVTGNHSNHWVYGSKWRIKSIEKGYNPVYGHFDLYEVVGVDGYDLGVGATWLEDDLELVEEEQNLTQQDTFKMKDIIDKLNIKKGKYVSDNGIEIEITEDTVILGNKHNKEFVIPIEFNDTFKEDRKLTLDDFDLEEEFKVLNLEGVWKKTKIFDKIVLVRQWEGGTISTYNSLNYVINETLIKLKKN